jgi:formylmethanofuran dehydrogenase subunit E
LSTKQTILRGTCFAKRVFTMRPFEELLGYSSSLHGHLCAGQVLGVRMAMVGCREIGIEEPRASKKLVVYVEIDGCPTDAIQAVTGCSLGKRSLKFFDYGKMAATFVNLETQKAVRVVARDEARAVASSNGNGNSHGHGAHKDAYRAMPEEILFDVRPAAISIADEDLPGSRGRRQICARCGEGVNFRREVERNGERLCIPCARGSYLTSSRNGPPAASTPKTLLIVGKKDSGKTSLVETLIPQLRARGYRVGTIKQHRSGAPLDIDRPGKDSWRHRRAGASAVVLISTTELAAFQDLDEAPPLEPVIAGLKGLDLVLVEGFKDLPKPRIEIGEIPRDHFAIDDREHVLAVVSPPKLNGGAPRFDTSEINRLLGLIEARILGRSLAVYGIDPAQTNPSRLDGAADGSVEEYSSS